MLYERDTPVLVTGASSGIGRSICEFLASNKHSVIAGVRKHVDFEELTKLTGVMPLRLDVTKADEVEEAVKQVSELGRGLYGLVNCAGVAGLGPLFDTSDEEFSRVLGVNLIGVHRMIHEFGPLLVESHGRIVNISSIGGLNIDTWLGPYGTSKHGLEGYGEILREEMAPHGVQVITIEPSGHRSKIGENAVDLMGSKIDTAWQESIFRDEMKQVLEWWLRTPDGPRWLMWPDPKPVAEAVSTALFSEHPKPRYLVSSREAAIGAIDTMLARVIEVNDGHPNPLSGPELVTRLEKALAMRQVQHAA